MNRSHSELDGLEKLLESLIKMVGKTNEKVDGLSRRVHQLEVAASEQSFPKVYSFIADATKPEELEKA
ncbi:hypothetical protein [Mesobacillus maritimus]|uniref:hypothetical protein n=1 Tax=Mesobacillus maritimus TaxID=1643336 RepID=UPI0038511C72